MDSLVAESVIDPYKLYLSKKYANQFSLGNSPDEKERLLQFFIGLEVKVLLSMGPSARLSMVQSDPELQELEGLSYKAFDYAKKALKDSVYITPSQANAIIESAKKCAQKVAQYNSAKATDLLSELILDCRFSSGESKLISLRINRIK